MGIPFPAAVTMGGLQGQSRTRMDLVLALTSGSTVSAPEYSPSNGRGSSEKSRWLWIKMSCAPSEIAACSSRAVLTTVTSAAACAAAVASVVSSMRRWMAVAGTVVLTPGGGLSCSKHGQHGLKLLEIRHFAQSASPCVQKRLAGRFEATSHCRLSDAC